MFVSYVVHQADCRSVVTVANIVAPITLVLLMLFGGFFINSANVPVYLIWLQYLSFFKYAFEALVINEFTGYVAWFGESSLLCLIICAVRTQGGVYLHARGAAAEWRVPYPRWRDRNQQSGYDAGEYRRQLRHLDRLSRRPARHRIPAPAVSCFVSGLLRPVSNSASVG